MLGTWTGAY